MLFTYKVIDDKGQTQTGSIEAVSKDVAVSSLQRRRFVVVSVEKKDDRGALKKSIPFFDKVPLKEIVIMSRQLSTLFEAQVSAVQAFTLIAENSENATLRDVLSSVSQDIQGGITIAQAMVKHPRVFSDFFVNMVAAGEEAGKLTDTFTYLAEYLERQYELTSKTRNALVYPIFVIFTFVAVMILMLVMVIPKLSAIIIESGQDVPIYTRAVIWVSDFFVQYGIFILIFVIIAGIAAWYLSRSASGKEKLDSLKLNIPYVGDLYKKLYLSRIADNINTMLSSGIPVVRTLEITSSVVDSKIYENILLQSVEGVKAGNAISSTFAQYEEMPAILVQMVKVGEETGSLGEILKTLARFYKREVSNAVDTLIGMIEPAMIIVLGVGVGFLLTSILIPIYNIATSI
ncbi:type II secretion system F family protein [Candidatus Nomurabacteria bacterium]|nr:type II secretion system F family protein [Candidatus Nomurabacteria bacterium]